MAPPPPLNAVLSRNEHEFTVDGVTSALTFSSGSDFSETITVPESAQTVGITGGGATLQISVTRLFTLPSALAAIVTTARVIAMATVPASPPAHNPYDITTHRSIYLANFDAQAVYVAPTCTRNLAISALAVVHSRR